MKIQRTRQDKTPIGEKAALAAPAPMIEAVDCEINELIVRNSHHLQLVKS